ncbi:hypothetical protein ACTXT7_001296 [Hymenolepis weldensis]
MDEIKLSPSAYQTIVTHALTHEKEEIIGLLFAEECEKHIQIYSAKPCPRITHQPDRVEMRDEDLASGIQEADRLQALLGRNIKVLGWYHSHPHTTVHPSSHDKATQALYEASSPKFFGIIVSVFTKVNGSKDDEKQQEIRITSFRSDGETSTKLTIEPIEIDPSTKFKLFQIDMENWRSIPGVLFEEVEYEPVYGNRMEKINQLNTKTVFPMATICNELNEKLQAQ